MITTALTTPRAATTTDVAVEAHDLVKTFPAPGGGTLSAVDHLSFSVRRGEIFGFLGPNGAGKTTLLEIVEGLQDPTAGHAAVLGLDSQRDRARLKECIGVQLQAGAYFDFLTLEEILALFGSFYARRLPPRDLLQLVGLLEKRTALVRDLSGGQAHRFSVIAALVNDPDVVFLDEPTTGLDPQARHNLWDLITAIHRRGKTLILTTHYMEEAEALCERVAIIDQGRIRALDTPLALIQQLPAASRIRFVTRDAVPLDEAARLSGVLGASCIDTAAGRYELEVARAPATLPLVVDWVRRRGIELGDIQVVPATLEDAFLALTGRSLRE